MKLNLRRLNTAWRRLAVIQRRNEHPLDAFFASKTEEDLQAMLRKAYGQPLPDGRNPLTLLSDHDAAWLDSTLRGIDR